VSLRADHLSYGVRGRKLLDAVSLQLKPGEVHALLGPNGAGKSTLLKLLAGDLQPEQGQVELNGRPLMSWTARERARLRAVLPQSDSLRFGFTVSEVVALGRLPCPAHSPQREAGIVREALVAADAAHLSGRIYTTLSGGERARVQLARVMAQLWEPVEIELGGGARYLLLDEPTASLDLSHQHACLKMARCFAAGGVGVLAILHDPNLAMTYGDEVTLLRDGRMLASGTPVETLTEDKLEALYGIPVTLHRPAGLDRPVIWARP
jgi:iron complex transport system ATP-binding protein